jgi:predicted dehydrogenase/threonine dehydrogenase-like Zn-dependent dehydrogenase
MKQIIQDLKNGKIILEDVPAPLFRPQNLLIATRCTLISAGTERMLVEFGKANLLSKARSQPDRVRQVFQKIGTDGIRPTVEAVFNKLSQPLVMGYCNVGRVAAVGDKVTGFAVGDRVVSNGPHAEVVSAPHTLCARVPDKVSEEEAAFTVLGAVGLQGIRLANPTLGEAVVVTGLGLLGLMATQMLLANGCRVLGIDLDPARCELARQFGADAVELSEGVDPVAVANAFSRGRGVDAVLITASTKSNEPIHQAAQMCRKRGRIVLVGVTGLELSRADFYEKELTFQVSCSYGPGRYDENYEQKGHDYPFGLVRWTEQRNFEAFLDLLDSKRIDVRPLISHRFPLEHAADAYELVARGAGLGMLLDYSESNDEPTKMSRIIRTAAVGVSPGHPNPPVVAAIGSGNFAGQVLLPALRKTGARLKIISSANGVSGTHLGKKFGFEVSSTEGEATLSDKEINTLVITTRHDSHARYVIAGLKAGSNVFVEKPLCLKPSELDEIKTVYYETRGRARASADAKSASEKGVAPLLLVGFNRRFAPQVQKMKKLLDSVSEPKTLIMTVNAGMIPANHWTQDPEIGGGRIVGEGCHFIDLLRFLIGRPIVGVQAAHVGNANGVTVPEDKISFTLEFEDGSIGTVHYFSNGSKSFPKERLEVFCAGRVLQLDNFRRLKGYGWPGFKQMNLWRQDKGHAAEMQAFIGAIREGRPSPIPFDELVEVTEISFKVVAAASQPRLVI